MDTVHGFEFFPLKFDGDGVLPHRGEWLQLKARLASGGDVMFLAHGFRNDEGEAQTLYGELLASLRTHLDSRPEFRTLRDRSLVVAGVFWPSKSFSESSGSSEGGVQSAGDDGRDLVREELKALQTLVDTPADRARLEEALALVDRLDDTGVQDRFVDLVLATVHESQADPTEGLERVKSTPGSELLDRLGAPIVLPTVGDDDSDGGVAAGGFASPTVDGVGGVQGIGSFFHSLAGRVGRFLNLTTWYLMKERSATVGINGVAACVRELKALQPAPRVHIVGHSLGGRLVAGAAKALAQPPVCQVESLVMLQAAFSHFGLSADNGKGERGYFREVMEQSVVAGPMVATFSFEDDVVGNAYARASRLAGDNVRQVGDRNDPYGGIGRNGALRMATGEMAEDRLHAVGTSYTFAPRVLHCLDGSGGLIKDHSDIRNAEVTYAIAAALK